jgi:hypothetical protein
VFLVPGVLVRCPREVTLTPGSTLRVFKLIGDHAGRSHASEADTAKCPRCRARLRQTHDMQRATRFQYLRCPNGHGRLITFFDFLREKDFIRPLTAAQIADPRRNVQIVNCSKGGAPIDLGRAGATGLQSVGAPGWRLE